MSQPIALIVDDEPDILELLDITLSRMGIRTRSAADLAQARTLLRQQPFDLCLTDMRLPDGDGIELVQEINREFPALPVAVITAHGNMETAIQALKAGAFDFASKPIDLQMLRRLVETALRLRPAEGTEKEATAAGKETEPPLLGDSAPMQRIRTMIDKLARSQAPVYISGESGTGKELAARLIHLRGPRRDARFVAVNCGAIPQELMESEFFGHRKGSFTGAVADKRGLFQDADGGTLFLDEVADLPLPMQVKLLRAIQEKRIRPVGATGETAVDVRIISATHKDLGRLVEEGEFRQDLFYRINVIELKMPPLRERSEDIPLLVDHFLGRIAHRNRIDKPVLDAGAMRALRSHPYPGNVRELENILERAVALCEGGHITEDDIQLPHSDQTTLPEAAGRPLDNYLEEVERAEILKALEATKWNRTAAAKRLGMSFRQLRYRLGKLGIE
ncbi:MAG TPA: sigma-54-dependent Fis family transcriptional regulator [Sedimenticola thiotaurini]|uniref:Sigma-54-dependent Fis family transcriptional regulator n=1 Tax=Sedimenticola thiotaurini TaxID=1543721 RepID=A0A831RIJ7_9GAMM|nr:sigma-54-dependent Fis family transcriptional regulator [Sedimenticola thiotaurini]